ncbi:MAG TPA: CmcI family methyltransferase [Solirubrobacteraceae bacterium]|nr:CmcI family methyltransferase [Solirubrobacteraceae bacterium]
MTELTADASVTLTQQAAEALSDGRVDDARELLRVMLAEHVDLEDLNDFAVLCASTGDDAAAEALLRAALVIGGESASVRRNLEQLGATSATAAALPAGRAGTDDERWREELPPAVTANLAGSVQDYWRDRLVQHTQDTYMGVQLSKFPEDLRVYEHLLGVQKPDVIVELGSQFGASTLWFRDRLRTLSQYGLVGPDPQVICVDIDTSHTRANLAKVDPDHASSITVIEGDVCDPAIRAQVGSLIAPGANVFVIEDSAHIYSTTHAALELYQDLVPVGGFFVIEDGVVDVEDLRISPHWVRGVLPALHVWLTSPAGRNFQVRRDLEIYGVSCHPTGFLQRVAA